MAEVIFDSLKPNDACLQQQPQAPKPKQQDACRIEAVFHERGGTEGFSLSFKRQNDRFVMERTGNEIISGKALGLGFSETEPKFQSALLYSISIAKWIRGDNLAAFRIKHPTRVAQYLDFSEKFRNFVINGSLTGTDTLQRQAAGGLLREFYGLPVKEQQYAVAAAKILLKEKNLIVDWMLPRIEWFLSLTLPFLEAKTPLAPIDGVQTLRSEIKAWNKELLVFLGTGEGNRDKLKTQLDALVTRSIEALKSPLYFEDLYVYFFKQVEFVEQDAFFKSPAGKERLIFIKQWLQHSAEDRRAEFLLIGRNKTQSREVFSNSLVVQLRRAAQQGDLVALVESELKQAKMPQEWLRRPEIVTEIGEAIVAAIHWNPQEGGGSARVEVGRLQTSVLQLLRSHSIRRREYLIGSLAVLRSLFGPDFAAKSLKAWVKNQLLPVRLQWAEADLNQMKTFTRELESGIRVSVRRAESYLPWIEGSVALLGAGLIGAGVGTHRREVMVSGSTVGGLGVGALLAHFGSHLFFKNRPHNHFIRDAVGGLIGAGAGFGTSWYLTRPGPTVTMQPPPPPPPPPPDPGRRNPSDPYGH